MDATIKVGPKSGTLLTDMKFGYDLLYSIEKAELPNEIIPMGEYFLERCLTTNDVILTSDELREASSMLNHTTFT